MEPLHYIFKNNGLEKYNDTVFNHPSFDLIDNEYTFLIQPSRQTKFWRFGIRLSKSEEVEFYHPSGRYKNPRPVNILEDVHIGVGDWDDKAWINSNRIHLAQYYLTDYETELNSCDTYVE